jgi:hypothetical protein
MQDQRVRQTKLVKTCLKIAVRWCSKKSELFSKTRQKLKMLENTIKMEINRKIKFRKQ